MCKIVMSWYFLFSLITMHRNVDVQTAVNNLNMYFFHHVQTCDWFDLTTILKIKSELLTTYLLLSSTLKLELFVLTEFLH